MPKLPIRHPQLAINPTCAALNALVRSHTVETYLRDMAGAIPSLVSGILKGFADAVFGSENSPSALPPVDPINLILDLDPND